MTLATETKYRDTSFDYQNEDTSWGVHGIHPYPAMMIYPIARRLLLEYSKEQDIILDSFMGSGTVLVESILHNRGGYGFDINPLALLLAKVKTTPIKSRILLDTLQDILYKSDRRQIKTPAFYNIDFWFRSEVIKNLTILKAKIETLQDPRIKDFFKVVFSQTVRASSNTRNGEFKLLKIKDLESHNPDVFKIFKDTALKYIGKLSETYKTKPKNWLKIFEIDTRLNLPVKPNSVDLILTSPPYGDSRTTVAYGQFSRLSLQWLGYEKVNIDKESLGGIRTPSLINDLESPSLQQTLKKIAFKDENRARDVLSFYIDISNCFINLKLVLKQNGYFCLVIGNRRVKQVTIPTDEIIVELMEGLGFSHIKTIIREIPTKRMPRINSPTNISGETEETMSKEYIVILRKEKKGEI